MLGTCGRPRRERAFDRDVAAGLLERAVARLPAGR
jgi:hypothetical protein